MTLREVYHGLLVEQNKNEAPSLLLEDFNYFVKKAIYKTIDDEYTAYEMHQIITDDLQYIKKSEIVTVFPKLTNAFESATYQITLKSDYYHLLGVVLKYKKLGINKCGKVSDKIYKKGVAKLRSDMFTGAVSNYYFRPSWKCPFYFFNSSIPQNVLPINEDNPLPISFELRCGDDDINYQPLQLYYDYLSVPKEYVLTQTHIDADTDTSPILEFNESMCFKILNNLTMLVFENTSDNRLQSNVSINKPQATARS